MSVNVGFLDSPLPLAMAHRGGALYGPNVGRENTLTAFANAVDLGYRYLETDVRVSSDGVPYAVHDAALDRISDRTGRLADLPAAQVDEVRVGDDRIPRLAELFATFPDARFNIDVKEHPAVGPTIDAVREAGAEGRVCLASFSHARLATIRRTAPDLLTSSSPYEVAQLWFDPWRALRPLRALGAQVVQVPPRRGPLTLVSPRLIRSAHDHGLQVHVWTVDERAAMEHFLDLGVDGLITDRIDVLRDVLLARGQWDGATS